MKGVILAAGFGSRLSEDHRRIPKVLLPVGGRAIIEHTLEAFAHVGVTDLGIVVGHQADAVKQWVGDGTRQGLSIRYIYNPRYRWGNAVSLHVAKTYTGDAPFLLAMADHMIAGGLLSLMLDVREQGNVLAVDFSYSPRDAEEGTRVFVDGRGLVNNIGKGLYLWNAIDTGVFRFTPAIYDALDEVIGDEPAEYQLSQAVARMIDRGQTLQACDVSGCFWQDVDTLEDLNLVRETLVG